MQCSSCAFENMPGTDVCCRCGSSLRLSTAVLDVNPPRAGRFRKSVRRLVRPPPGYYGLRENVRSGARATSTFGAQLAEELTPMSWPAWPVIWRCVVPGWSHRYLGQHVRAHLFFWAFITCIVPALLTLGSGTGSVMLGLAFSVHSAAASDVFNQGMGRGTTIHQIGRSILVTIALAVLVYVPLALLLSRFALIRNVEVSIGPLEAGDTVLVNTSPHTNSWPAPGQVVLYTLSDNQFGTLGGGGREHTIYLFFGEHVDRVLARAGDRVRWEHGALTVNDRSSSLRPFSAGATRRTLNVTVPADCVFILPTTTPRAAELPDAEFESMTCVPIGNVIGTVYWRYRPFSRMGVIR